MSRILRCAAALGLSCLAFTAQAQTVPADLTLTSLNLTGVSSPIAFAAPNDGTARLFVASRGGNIYVYHLDTGITDSTPLLTVPVSTSGEQGLLGIALHPNFASNGKFYVQHSRASGGGTNIGTAADQLTVEYTASPPTSNVVNPGTRRVLVTIGDMASNHNGGGVQFGPDGYLYISMGDGGPQNNPHGFAQCLWRKPADNNPANCSPGGGVNYSLLGKILRIDVDATTPTASAEMCGTATGQMAQYAVPADNPHTGTNNTCDEIYHTGMRNPFRFSFDRLTGDMLVGDVGQGSWEEVDLIAAGAGAQNLGWSACEGRQSFPGGAAESCAFGLLPILNYNHGAVSPASSKCSITGGYRYRGPIVEFHGMIVYADYCSREIFFGKPDGSAPSGFSTERWATGPTTPILAASNPIGFGEDVEGNLYLATQGGSAFRFTSATGVDMVFRDGFE
jgi:glucose/arabinose dehydrogenase